MSLQPSSNANCPSPYYGRLRADLTEPYNGADLHRCIYGARISNSIFDKDYSKLKLSQGYVQFKGDLRKFKVTCPNDPNVFIIINIHVDDGGAILTWRTKYDETLQALSNRYAGTLDSSPMDRYLGMGFNSETMYHSVLKVLVTFCTLTSQSLTSAALVHSSGNSSSASRPNSQSSWPARTTLPLPKVTKPKPSASSPT